MKCPYCGKDHQDGAKFCTVSGEPLPEVSSPPAGLSSTCQNCGMQVQPYWSVCTYCGAPIDRRDPKANPKKKLFLIGAILLGVLSFVVIASGVILLLKEPGERISAVGTGSDSAVVSRETMRAQETQEKAQQESSILATLTVIAKEQENQNAPVNATAPPTRIPTQTRTAIPTFSDPATATSTPKKSGTWEACPGTYLSRLHIDDYAVVSLDPNLPNRVRASAGTTHEILGFIRPGEKIKILDGPTCQSQWVWWKIRSEKTGLTGWTAEGDKEHYWLVPTTE
jgi:hypothetical protein